MVPMNEEAHDSFVEVFGMPAECDSIDVGEYDPLTVIDRMPKKFLFGNTKKEPKLPHTYLFYES